jgi:hypothetical protein
MTPAWLVGTSTSFDIVLVGFPRLVGNEFCYNSSFCLTLSTFTLTLHSLSFCVEANTLLNGRSFFMGGYLVQ